MDRLRKLLESIEGQGETSKDHKHWHTYKVTEKGEGSTIKTLPEGHPTHVHKIKNFVVGEVKDHIHNI